MHGRNELEERQTSKLLIFLKLVRSRFPPCLRACTLHHVAAHRSLLAVHCYVHIACQ